MTTDNTGTYLSWEEMIAELLYGNSALLAKANTALSVKTVDAGGDVFQFSGTAPGIGDAIEQAGHLDTVKEVLTAPSRVRVTRTGAENLIVNGGAQFLHAEKLPKPRAEALIATASAFIDQATGQFFNKRSATINIQGNNTPVLWLPVPIIEVTYLNLNGDVELFEGFDRDFVAFKGRTLPQDDRRNPKIRLDVRKNRQSIFTGRDSYVFSREALTEIRGAFGFLEADGSTPSLIKRATFMLAITDANKPLSDTGLASASVGGLKREKVDVHEKEFFERKAGASIRSASGNSEVDEILARYRTPVRVDGSIEVRTWGVP
jgi:hypothetical protein